MADETDSQMETFWEKFDEQLFSYVKDIFLQSLDTQVDTISPSPATNSRNEKIREELASISVPKRRNPRSRSNDIDKEQGDIISQELNMNNSDDAAGGLSSSGGSLIFSSDEEQANYPNNSRHRYNIPESITPESSEFVRDELMKVHMSLMSQYPNRGTLTGSVETRNHLLPDRTDTYNYFMKSKTEEREKSEVKSTQRNFQTELKNFVAPSTVSETTPRKPRRQRVGQQERRLKHNLIETNRRRKIKERFETLRQLMIESFLRDTIAAEILQEMLTGLLGSSRRERDFKRKDDDDDESEQSNILNENVDENDGRGQMNEDVWKSINQENMSLISDELMDESNLEDDEKLKELIMKYEINLKGSDDNVPALLSNNTKTTQHTLSARNINNNHSNNQTNTAETHQLTTTLPQKQIHQQNQQNISQNTITLTTTTMVTKNTTTETTTSPTTVTTTTSSSWTGLRRRRREEQQKKMVESLERLRTIPKGLLVAVVEKRVLQLLEDTRRLMAEFRRVALPHEIAGVPRLPDGFNFDDEVREKV